MGRTNPTPDPAPGQPDAGTPDPTRARLLSELRDLDAPLGDAVPWLLPDDTDRLDECLEQLRACIVEYGADGRLLYVSPSATSLIGIAPEELLGFQAWSRVHDDDLVALIEASKSTVCSARPVQIVFRVLHKRGDWVWLEATSQLCRTPEGEPRCVSFVRDVGDQMRAESERRDLERRLQQSQRLESLGLLAGSIAHDFNNLLTPILGDAGLALMDAPEGSALRARLEKIQQAARKAAALTGQMLAYAGQGPARSGPLDLSRLVREMAQLLECSLSRRAKVRFELAEDLPAIHADAAQLSQVVMNLLTNAADALPESGGSVVIRTGEQPSDADGEKRVYFEVQDDGCGMDASTRARIFEPFFTTKVEGRGLGLSAVLDIVRGHGGEVDIASKQGCGTRFRAIFAADGRNRV